MADAVKVVYPMMLRCYAACCVRQRGLMVDPAAGT